MQVRCLALLQHETTDEPGAVRAHAAGRGRFDAGIARLVWRCWPYYRPQLKHLVTYLILNALMGVFLLGGGFVGIDLLNNKVLVGKKLQPLQAVVLFAGDEYTQSGAAPRASVEAREGA